MFWPLRSVCVCRVMPKWECDRVQCARHVNGMTWSGLFWNWASTKTRLFLCNSACHRVDVMYAISAKIPHTTLNYHQSQSRDLTSFEVNEAGCITENTPHRPSACVWTNKHEDARAFACTCIWFAAMPVAVLVPAGAEPHIQATQWGLQETLQAATWHWETHCWWADTIWNDWLYTPRRVTYCLAVVTQFDWPHSPREADCRKDHQMDCDMFMFTDIHMAFLWSRVALANVVCILFMHPSLIEYIWINLQVGSWPLSHLKCKKFLKESGLASLTTTTKMS